MFENLRYAWAVHWTLTDLLSRNAASKEQVLLMDRIAKNQMNKEYGTTALRYKMVPDKYAAAAAVFGRLAALYHVAERNGLNGIIFEEACEAGLRLAKCPAHLINGIKQHYMDASDISVDLARL